MIAALSLLLGALAAGWLVPRHLSRADKNRRDPRPLIVAWLLGMLGIGLAGIVGIVMLLLPDPAASPLTWAFDQCWTALEDGSPPRFEDVVGVLSVAALAGLLGRLGVVATQECRRTRRSSCERLALLRLAGRTDERCARTLWLAHDRPLAFSLASRPGIVVATEGLRRHLPAKSVAAVLAHEHAHLRGRHHLLVMIADILRRTLPFVPLFRQAPNALRELVELEADTAAVRACGTTAVRTALLGVTGQGSPEDALAMARDAVGLRLARLERDTEPPVGARRAASCGVAGIAAAAFPFVTGAALLLGVAVVACW